MQSRSHSRLILILFSLCFAVLPALAHEEPDLTKLPIGDGKLSQEPMAGYVWRCGDGGPSSNGGAQVKGPWFNSDGTSFDMTKKYIVDGDVMWPSEFDITIQGTERIFTGNALPNHGTGVYPVARTDDAAQVDPNPNTISAQELSFTLPLMPTVAAEPSCMGGAVAVLLTGSVVFDGLDAEKRDAVAHETQDACQGHPEGSGQYHYHSLTPCLEDAHEEGTHSALMGYAMDGFGLYGHDGEEGALLANEDLDECHGHIHEITWEGQLVEMYHYHATYEYPYTIGCYRGTPVRMPMQGGQGAQGQGQGQGQGQPPTGGQGGQPPAPPTGGQGQPPAPPTGGQGQPPAPPPGG